MVKKIIKIPTNENKVYQQILALMNFLLEATNQERNVLAELVKLNNEYEALPPEKRGKFILSTDMRKEMRSNLKLPEPQFNVIISNLKKKKVFGKPFISEDNILHPIILFKPDSEGYELTFSLVVKKEEESIEKSKELKEEVSKEKLEDKSEVKPKQLAKPANGKEGIIHNNFEDNITLV